MYNILSSSSDNSLIAFHTPFEQRRRQREELAASKQKESTTPSASDNTFDVPPAVGRLLSKVTPRTTSTLNSMALNAKYHVKRLSRLLTNLQMQKNTKMDKSLFVNIDEDAGAQNKKGQEDGDRFLYRRPAIWVSSNTFSRGMSEKQKEKQRKKEEGEEEKKKEADDDNDQKKKEKRKNHPRKLLKRKNRLSKKRRLGMRKAKKAKAAQQNVIGGTTKKKNKKNAASKKLSDDLARVSKTSVFRKIIKGSERKILSGRLEKCMRCRRRTKRLTIHAQRQIFVESQFQFMKNDFVPLAKEYCRELLTLPKYSSQQKQQQIQKVDKVSLLKRLLAHRSKVCSLIGMKVFVEVPNNNKKQQQIVSGIIIEHVRKITRHEKHKFISILVSNTDESGDEKNSSSLLIVLYKEKIGSGLVSCCNDSSGKEFVSEKNDGSRATMVAPFAKNKVKFCVGDDQVIEMSGKMVF